METNELMQTQEMPEVTQVSAQDFSANLYASGDTATYTTADQTGMTTMHLFVWITLTMMWVLMILSIMALLKYVTHEERKPRPKAK